MSLVLERLGFGRMVFNSFHNKSSPKVHEALSFRTISRPANLKLPRASTRSLNVHWLFYLSVRFNRSRSLQVSIHFEGLDKHHSHVCAAHDTIFFPVRRIEEKIRDLQLQYPIPMATAYSPPLREL
jgi:hypothetical protein